MHLISLLSGVTPQEGQQQASLAQSHSSSSIACNTHKISESSWVLPCRFWVPVCTFSTKYAPAYVDDRFFPSSSPSPDQLNFFPARKSREAQVHAPAGPVNADAVALQQLLLPDALWAQLRTQLLSHKPAHVLCVQPRICALLGRGYVGGQHLDVCQINELRLPPHEVPQRALHAAPPLVEVPATEASSTIKVLHDLFAHACADLYKTASAVSRPPGKGSH